MISHLPPPDKLRLRWRFFVVVFVLVAIALAAQLYRERERLLQTETSRLLDTSRYVDDNLSRQIVALSEALGGLREEYTDSAALPERARAVRQLKLLTNAMPSVSSISVFDADGLVLASDQIERVGQKFFSADQVAVPRREPDPQRLYVSRPDADSAASVALHISKAIFNRQGVFVGVVSATLDRDFFGLVIGSAIFSPDMRSTLTHVDGDIFLTVPRSAASGPVNVALPGSQFVQHVQSGKPSNVFQGFVQKTGQNRLIAFTNIQPPDVGMRQPLVLSISRDVDRTFAPWWEQVSSYTALYLITLLLATSGRVWSHRRQRAFSTAQAQVREELRETATRLERALAGADLGLWDYRIDERVMTLDARGYAMLGYGPNEIDGTVEAWTAIQHPADREPNRNVFRRYLTGVAPAYEDEYRVARKDGSWVWLLTRGKVTQRDAEGRAVRMLGTFMDVTTRRENDDRLTELALLLRRSGEIAKIGGWTIDLPDGRTNWTQEVYRIYGLDSAQPLELEKAVGYFTATSQPLLRQAIDDALHNGVPWDLELELISAIGRRVWVRSVGEALYRDATLVRLAGALQDITERKLAALELERLNARLSELSYTDALTGLGNRRLFDETLLDEWNRGKRLTMPLAMLMIDIDHFKNYNDRHGHLGGDECLRRVSTVLEDSLRRIHEKALRYGGEEFAILLPNTQLDGAKVVADRLQLAMAQAALPHGNSPVSPFVTISIGLACVQPGEGGATADGLVEAADLALYRAKDAGRSRSAQ